MGLFDCNSFSSNNIHLIDGSNIFYRSALVQYSREANFSSRVANFFAMFNKALKLRPRYCAIVFDSGQLNFRHKLYPEYKANRSLHDNSDHDQLLDTIKDILRYSGFTLLKSNQYEADDIIGSLCNFASESQKVIIFSEDKDFIQLVDDNVFLYKGNILYTKEAVMQNYGIAPNQFIEYLALLGDSADNIPGIKMWGKKTIVEYLQEHKNIENIQQLTLKKSLVEIKNKKLVSLYKSLVTIKCDINVIDNIGRLEKRKIDYDSLTKLSKKFKLHIGKIGY